LIKDPLSFQGFLIFIYYIILFKNFRIIKGWIYLGINVLLNFAMYIWLFNTIHFFGQINIIISMFAILLIAIYLSFYQQLFFILLKKFERFIIFAPFVYVFIETLRGWFLSGFTFNLIGYSLYKLRFLIYPARIYTVYGVGFFIILISLLIGYKLTKKQRIIVFLFLFIYFLPSLFITFEKNKYPNINTIILETNFQPEDKRTDNFGVFKNYHLDPTKILLSALNTKPDLIVWSETAVPFILNKNYYIQETLKEFTKNNELSLVFGGEYFDGKHFFNSSYFLQNGEIKDRYDKKHLVIFGEFFPMKSIWPFNKLYGQFSSFTPGKEIKIFKVNNIGIFTPICYEIAFGNIINKAKKKGAKIIINISNDGWYGYSSGPYTEMAFAVFRAIESRVYVMRAINRGWAVIVTPKGKVLFKNPPQNPGFIFVDHLNKVSFYKANMK
ncbi:apolipoprotein N-acyltransferase, partial [bacterium]|nr:apolipoprotein N-acyltransferase [bacterium]